MIPLSKTANTPPQWRELFQQLEDQLDLVGGERKNRMENIRLSLTICRTTVEALKSSISNYSFSSIEEEIYFFKEVKPAYYSFLIYYLKLFHIEAGRPAGNNNLWEPQLNRILERIKYFFHHNLDFLQYYQSGDTYLDDKYFTRRGLDSYLKLDDNHYNYDASFSSSHDVKVARILAYEKLHAYVSHCKAHIISQKAGETNSSSLPSLTWTAAKVALIELLYALQSAGAFNNGTSDLKLLAGFFEQAFHIELGNYYNVFGEMRLRKKNRTSFLDNLRDRLLRRMDEADDNEK
ncbi:MAG: RteC domain-containing protein [Bacteroidota bacterium]|nr:RteC domain-containing protein [Bacteroidota bacterium]